jgi:hypothetical protein
VRGRNAIGPKAANKFTVDEEIPQYTSKKKMKIRKYNGKKDIININGCFCYSSICDPYVTLLNIVKSLVFYVQML